MEQKDQLTNEKIRKKFASQFDLVNYAIRLAENMIQTGRDPRVKIDSHNRSMQVLSEIVSGKDTFDVIVVEEEFEHEPRRYEDSHSKAFEKSSERKKSRKVFAE